MKSLFSSNGAVAGAAVRLFPCLSSRVVAVLATAAYLMAGSAGAVNISWNNDFGNWNTAGNWSPAGPPAPADAVFIGNTAIAENAFVTLNIDDTIAAMTISDGMVLNTDGHALLVNGDVLVTGENQDGNVVWSSRIQVKSSGNSYDLDVNNLTVNDGAGLELWDGGILAVDNVLQVAAGSNIYGDGVINLGGNEPRVFINDGVLQVAPGSLTLNQNGAGRIDLDGNSGDGHVSVSTYSNITMEHSTLTINGDLLADAFSGSMSIGGGFVTMNLSGGGWTAAASSEIDFFGLGGDTAKLNGSHVTFGGLANIYGIAEINAPSTWIGSATASIRTNDELRLDGAATFDGASFVQEAATTGGVVTNNGGLAVIGDTTIDLPTGVFDWDGDAANANTNIQAGATFTLNVNAIDNDPGGDPYDGNTDVGAGATLAVNTSGPWELNGSIDLTNGSLTGSGVVIGSSGQITGRGSVQVASIDNGGMIGASIGTLTVQASGTNDLDGSNENGRLSAAVGDLTILGINSLFDFDGELSIGFLGLPRTYLMPTGGLDNDGLIEMNGGTYEAGLRQDGQLNVHYNSRIKSDGVFGADGVNTIDADLRLDGDFVVETGAAFNGSGEVVVLEGSQLNGQHNATVALPVDNFGRVEPGQSTGLLNVADFTNEVGGTLAVELMSAGGVLGIDHDLLDVRGEALLLGGTLEASFLNGFTPSLGDSFLVLRTLEGVTGTFANLVQPQIPGVKLMAVYDEFTVTLATVAIPEPSTAGLVICGILAGCAGMRGTRVGQR
jgi:hypothetical protein